MLVKLLKFLKRLFTSKRAEVRVTRVLQNNFNEWSPIEREIASRLNILRKSENKPMLLSDKTLREKALERVDFQIKRGKVSHEFFFDTVRELENTGYSSVAEILGYGYNNAISVVSAWVKSEGHSKIVFTKRVSYFGVGVKEDAAGRKVFCVLFSN